MLIYSIKELRKLIANLPDDMPVRGMDDEVPVMLVCDYDDIPTNPPPPTLVIEL